MIDWFRDVLSLWLSTTRRVGPRAYAATGFALMPIKYAGDAAMIYAATGEVWTPVDYLTPRLLASWMALTNEHTVAVVALVVWTLPFVYVGASMTMRRGLDAGFPGVAALLFFVPVVNYVWMLSLCAFPSVDRSRAEAAATPAASPMRAELLAAGPAAALGLAVGLLSIFLIESYGAVLFVGTPFVMGFVAAYRGRRLGLEGWRARILVGQLSLVLVAALLVAFALEGLLCIAMAAPIAMVLAALGSLLGASAAASGGAGPAGALGVFGALPLLLGFEAVPREPPRHEVVTTIEIAAPPEVVWRNVVGFSELPPPTRLVFALGVAHPRRARIEGEGVGAIRHCEFSTGSFVEPITVWDEPRRLAFDVIAQPEPMHEWSPYARVNAPHLLDGLQARRGEFRLVPVAPGRTRLVGTTVYTLDMAPAIYWTIWSDALIHAIHQRVLQHIRQISEHDWGSGAAGSANPLESAPERSRSGDA